MEINTPCGSIETRDKRQETRDKNFLPFPYAQLSEVWKAELQLFDGLCAGDVVFGVTGLALPLYPAHDEVSIGVVAGRKFQIRNVKTVMLRRTGIFGGSKRQLMH